MAVDSTFRALISVVDQTAGPLRAISNRIEAIDGPVRNLGQSFDLVNGQLQRMGTMPSLSNLGLAAREAGGHITTLGTRLFALVGPMAALAVGGGVASLGHLAVNAAAAGDDLGDLSERTGIATERLQAWQDAASRAGIGSDVFIGNIERLQKAMNDAANGKNEDVAALFRHLRMPLRDAQGIRAAADVMPDLADAFMRTGSQAMKLRVAMALMGESGAQMLPFFNQGKAAMKEAEERFKRFAFVMSKPMTAAASEADSSFKNLATSLGGLGDAIGHALGPTLGPIAQQMAEWTRANRDWIANSIGAKVAELAKAVRAVVDAGDWKPLAQSMGTVTAAALTLTALMATNPFLGFAAAAGAAALLIYKHWDEITGFFSNIGASIRDSFKGMGPQVDWLVGVFSAGASTIKETWSGLVHVFEGVWHGLVSPFVEAWQTIKGVLDEMGLLSRSVPALPSGPSEDQQQQQRLRSGRERDRGRAGGFYGTPPVDPDAPLTNQDNGLRFPMTGPRQLIDPSALLAPRPVTVVQPTAVAPTATDDRLVVRFENAPVGMRVTTETNRPNGNRGLDVDVGYSMRDIP